MSETVAYKGKVKSTGKTLGEFLNVNITVDNEDEMMDMFYNDFGGKNVLIGDVVYEVVERSRNLEYEDIFEASSNPDGTIDFLVKYYNGGCGFDEAIGYAIKKMEENNAK